MLEQDEEIIFKFKNGDRAAFAELYQRYIRYAFGTALLLVKDTSIASDVCQDAFIKVYQNIHSFKEGHPFKPWFYRIVVNEAMRITRKIMLLPKPVDKIPDIPSSAYVGPESNVINKEVAFEIRQALNRLPSNFKIPLTLRYYSELTEEEIAAALKIPIGTVKSRLSRGRKQLEALLKNCAITLGGFKHA